jgi:hypothetical protein
LVGFVGLESSWSCSCYATGVMPMSKVFGYRWDACELGSILATGVTPVSMWPLVTGNNLGVWSCLDIV